MTDPLLEAIRAAPDDDAPRLVWADREGGERGELVVVQCALAAAKRPPREELRRLYEREAELIATFKGARYVRGFVNEVWLRFDEIDADPELSAWPLAHTVHLRDTYVVSEEPAYPDLNVTIERTSRVFERLPSRITGLGVSPTLCITNPQDARTQFYTEKMLRALAVTERGRKLHALHVTALLEDPSVLEPFTELEDLSLYPSFDTAAVLATPRPLRRLSLIGDPPSSLQSMFETHPSLVDLDLESLDDQGVLAVARGRLEHLVLRHSTVNQHTKEAFAASPALAGLRSLFLDYTFDEGWAEVLPRATFASGLRKLHCRAPSFGPSFGQAKLEYFTALPALEHLRLDSRHRELDLTPFRAAIPYVTA